MAVIICTLSMYAGRSELVAMKYTGRCDCMHCVSQVAWQKALRGFPERPWFDRSVHALSEGQSAFCRGPAAN